MSRVGKKLIIIPSGVTIQSEAEGVFRVKGPKGEMKVAAVSGITVHVAENKVTFLPKTETKKSAALWGLARALFANAVQGVSVGFTKKLMLEGIGYRAEVQGRTISFNLGFSHPVIFPIPETIEVKVEKNIITVSGVDKALVGEVAAKIRDLKKPEPYKGKGIRYIDEVIKIKAGKKAVSAAA